MAGNGSEDRPGGMEASAHRRKVDHLTDGRNKAKGAGGAGAQVLGGGFGVPPTAVVAQRAAAQPDRGAAAMVARARARGEWRDDADPEVVLSALLGAITQRVLLERREATAAWVDAVVDLTLRAVAPSRVRSRGPAA